jgi:hypothetical protein
LCVSWNNKRFSESKCTLQQWKLSLLFGEGSKSVTKCLAFWTTPFMASPFYIQQNDNKWFHHNQGEIYDCVKEE